MSRERVKQQLEAYRAALREIAGGVDDPKHAAMSGLLKGGFEIMELGAHLRLMRESQGVTQAELAERLFVNPTQVSRWERQGYKSCVVDTVIKIVKELGFNVELSIVDNEKREFAREFNEAYKKLRADPDAWKAYQEENKLFDNCVADGLEKIDV